MPLENNMTTITLPDDLETPLAEAARKRGTSPELLALDALRQLFIPRPVPQPTSEKATLFEFLAGHIGTVNGTTEALSEKCGQRFTGALVEKQQRGNL